MNYSMDMPSSRSFTFPSLLVKDFRDAPTQCQRREHGTMSPMHLATPRLLLRAFTSADFEWIHPIASDPSVTRFTDWGPNTVRDTHEFLREATTEGAGPDGYMWAVTLLDGTGIGSASLHHSSAHHQRASFGYMLNPNQWGHGYATEVATAVLDFALDTLTLHRVEATCHPDNKASGRVLEKAGLRFEGTMRGHLLVRGEWRDSRLYAVLASDRRPS
jgi:RimJ/RimL family protein N-acetyltransferase